jgi:hypothetical protein
MSKLTLDLQSLAVQTFETEEMEARGTVNAHDESPVSTGPLFCPIACDPTEETRGTGCGG